MGESGSGEPTARLYRLVGREPTGFGLGGRRLSPLVGRTHELDLLLERVRQIEGGHGHVVGVVGEPGIGKSRLSLELRGRLQDLGVPCLEGRCLSRGAAVPYLPMTDLLRHAWAIDEADRPEHQAAAVRSRLATLGLDPDHEAPYLLRVLGLEAGTEPLAALSPEGLKLGTFDALRRVLLAAARGTRLALLLEDLHWTDRSSEEFLLSLVDALPGAPILLVVTARPGYRPPWMDRSWASQLALPRLSTPDSVRLVQSVLRDRVADESTTRRLAAHGEGNPFFLEELAWAVAQGGGAELDAAPIPATIEATLTARLDRLDEGPRRLLETAAVLGRAFPRAVLEPLWTGGRLADHLRTLVALEFLHEQAPGTYAFKHALTQEVAYGRPAAAERARLHGAAGHAYETLYTGRLHEIIDRLAYHFSRTLEHAKAVRYLAEAADRAGEGYALSEAATLLAEAMRHAEQLPDPERRDRARVELATRHVWPLTFLGRLRELSALLGREEERVARLKDPGLAGPYYWALAMTYDHLCDRARARPTALRALEYARVAGDTKTMALAHYTLADEAFFAGRFAEGLRDAGEAIRLLEDTTEWFFLGGFFLGYSNWILGVNAVAMGDFALAAQASAVASRVATRMGDLRVQCYAAWLDGWALALAGDAELGLARCQDAVQRAPDPVAGAAALHFLGAALIEAGRMDEAIAPLQEAAGRHSAAEFSALHGWDLALLSEAVGASGEPERAGRMATDALQCCDRSQFPLGIGLAYRALGRALLAQGDGAEAAAALGRAGETFAAIDARYELARTLLELARVAHLRGDPGAASAHLGEAHRLFTTLEVPYWAERTAALARELGVQLPGLPAE
jgi:tetratricopeptide (TPR) repeat protein